MNGKAKHKYYYEEDIDVTFTNSGSEDVFCNYYGNAYYPGNGITDCASLYAYYGSPFTASSDVLLTEPGRIRGEYSGWAAYIDLNYAINDQAKRNDDKIVADEADNRNLGFRDQQIAQQATDEIADQEGQPMNAGHGFIGDELYHQPVD